MGCDWQRVEELFHSAAGMPPLERGAYLAGQCADDEVRREVESLLVADDSRDDLPEPFLSAPQAFAAGQQLNGYEILEICGQGASAAVYRARNIAARSLVAIKVFQPFLSPEQRRRYLKEARAASALDHPNVVKVREIGRAGDRDYLAMDFVEGRTLGEVIPAGGLPLGVALNMARMMAQGLAAAHAAGIVHRDLKPANLMVDREGTLKVLDFGLAKVIEGGAKSSMETVSGQIVGTACYLSPEQAEGKPVDARSDVFSFGAVLYEMLTGERVFDRGSLAGTLSAILRDAPQPVRKLRPKVPRQIARIVERCLEKEPAQRYASAGEVVRALDAYQSGQSAWYRKPRFAVPLAAASAALLVGTAFWGERQVRIHWARTMVPRIATLLAAQRYSAADEVVHAIENIIPADQEVRDFRRTYRIVTTAVTTTPPGAEVDIQDYATPAASWRVLGRAPLKNLLLPIGYFRWRVSAPGYRTREFAETPVLQPAIHFQLYKDADAPPGMVLVPAGATWGGHAVRVSEFWLDQFEVTNRQYQAFVDDGGYRRAEFWQEPVLRDGRVLSFDEAMQLFRDQTGRPGPSTWELGTYAEGKAEFPVTGVSWYEAAAYSRFAGKSLPAYNQWLRASRTEWLYAEATLVSNFSGKGLAPVGNYRGLDRFGSYDLAGNAKEWIWNEARPGQRMVLGGAWDEAYYAAQTPDVASPVERLANTGFRCVKNVTPLPENFMEMVHSSPARDFSRTRLVTDREFSEILKLYDYPPAPLRAQEMISDDTSRYWRKLKVSFAASYEDQKILAYLFLPRSSAPPYQTVVYFPSGVAAQERESRYPEMWYLEPIIRSGRAVLYPVLWGTYERHDPSKRYGLDRIRTNFVRQVQDVRRSVDYLQSRPDLDGGKLAYFGFSQGTFMSPLVLATEPRFKAALLAVGGLGQSEAPADVDPFQFAPRAHVPVLMMNGRYDLAYPLETTTRPLFDLWGVPPRDKKLVILDAGHAMVGFPATTRESLDWLDRYLGQVR